MLLHPAFHSTHWRRVFYSMHMPWGISVGGGIDQGEQAEQACWSVRVKKESRQCRAMLISGDTGAAAAPGRQLRQRQGAGALGPS